MLGSDRPRGPGALLFIFSDWQAPLIELVPCALESQTTRQGEMKKEMEKYMKMKENEEKGEKMKERQEEKKKERIEIRFYEDRIK